MAKYLSQEWIDETRALAADQPERPGASVRLQYQVNGGPDGDVEYYWVVEDGKLVESNLGKLDDSEVTMSMTWDDSVAVQKGDLDANTAFMQGKAKVTGNMAKLMGLLPITNSPEYRELQERIRAVTEY